MSGMSKGLIAPCGMNCRLCMAYQREKKHCIGCREEADIKYRTKGCTSCVIKNCPVIKNSESGFCYECSQFPCTRLKQLDRRYRTKYRMSMVENLERIRLKGIDDFLRYEDSRWTCRNCGGTVCVHKFMCLSCRQAYT